MTTRICSGGGGGIQRRITRRKQLLKAVKDEISVMAEEPGGYTAGQWYRFKVSIMDGAIKTYIDNRLIFDVVDRTIFHGRVGLWIDGPKREADAGMVRFWPGRFAGDSWKHQFAIQMDRGNYQHAVYFCYQNNRNHYVLKRLAATGPDKRALLRLFRVVDGISVLLDQKYDVMEYPKTYSIVVTKLGDRLMLDIKEPVQKEIGNIISNAKVGFEISNPFFTGGRIGYDTGRAVNARFDDVVVRSIHDFNDPFAADELGNPLLWKQLKGNLKVENGTLTSVSGNTSVAIAGQRDWSDYVYSVDVALCGDSIQPAGLLFYYHDEGNNYRLDFGGSGAGPVISLVKKIKGVETILDTATRGGLLRSFETFSVELDDGWIGVYNNGERIAGSYDFDLKDGEIGLYGHGVRSSIFDNVNVSFDDGDDALNIVDIDFETYDESMVSMDGFPGWTVSGGRCSITDGSLMIETSGGSAHLDYRDDFFYGNVSVLFGVRADGMDNPHVNIMLYEHGGGTNGGYIFTFDRSGASLYKGGVLVASSESQTMRSMEKYLLRIDKRRGHILCFIDGQCVIARRDEGYTIDYCTAVSMDDGLLLIDEIRILGFPAYHNDFSLAKLGARDLSNWYVGTGDWNVVSFHGYGLHGQKTTDGDASIYFKDRLPRNASIEFEIYPLASNPSGHFVVSIYNDGEDYYSGYLHHIEYNFIESAKDVYSNYVNVTVMKNDDVLKTENRIIGPREERKTKFRIVKIDDVLKLYISNILIYELHGVDPPGGNMMSLGVMGARFNPTFINYVSVYAID